MRMLSITRRVILIAIFSACISVSGQVRFIDYYFENGSPLLWEIDGNDVLRISLLPDYERNTLNRQTDHWYFKILARKGDHIKLIIRKMLPDVYNGREADDWWNYPEGIPCYLSYDNINWQSIRTTTLPGKDICLEFGLEEDSVFLARLPVYSNIQLENLKKRISKEPGIRIFEIGKSLENRPLEIIQLGNPLAKHQVILRARAHPWEPGGNWVIEGVIDEFLKQRSGQHHENFCFYIMPMANRDGVARGMTRFNTAGMDLNRNWDSESDSLLCPEKYCFEKFIAGLVLKGLKPDLVIDLHNDDKGDIHLSSRKKDDYQFIKNMKYFEQLLRGNTSFSESMQYSWEDGTQPSVMTISDGLYHRFGIDALVYELNANWISGIKKIPSADDWKETGKGLTKVLYEYLDIQ